MISGKISKVSGSTFVIKATGRGSQKTTAVSVTVTSKTDYTVTKTAKASAIKTGNCVSAFGTSDDTGAVTATRMSLSKADNGTCSNGFGGGFGPGQSGKKSNG
jgi:hypothetical protein